MRDGRIALCTRRRALPALVVLLLAIPGATAGQEPGALINPVPRPLPQYAQAVAQAQSLIRDFMEERGAPGLSVAVGVDGTIVWSEGFGYALVEHRVPVTTLTRFRSGSIAKPITATAMARMYEQGIIDLDAPIQRYVPAFPRSGGKDRVTLRLLSGHLAGFRHYPPDGDEFFSSKRYLDLADALEIFQDDPLLFAPGADYSYSTYGTVLQGVALQGAARKPFLEVVQELVFDPLNMRSSSGDHSDSIIPYRTGYYERTGQRQHYHLRKTSWGDGSTRGVLLIAPFADNSSKHPGGGFMTTPEDLVRFGSAHLAPGFLKPETLRMMQTPMKTAAGRETGYGMNWGIGSDSNGRRTVSHGGGSIGGTSFLVIYPDQKVVLAIQCNLTQANYGDLTQRLAELFLASSARRSQ